MISFETLQECRDLNDLLPYILNVMFEDFVRFIIKNGCAGLTEEELVEFEELDRLMNGPAAEEMEPALKAYFNELIDKAAWDPDTRHAYALAVRLYSSTEPEETADIDELDDAEDELVDALDDDTQYVEDDMVPQDTLDEQALRSMEASSGKVRPSRP